MTQLPFEPPLPWLWSCHHCHTRYPLGTTRRCLHDGHYFCGGTTVSALTGRPIRRHRACASEFDYAGWLDMSKWRRHRATNAQVRGSEQTACRQSCETSCCYPSACHHARRQAIRSSSVILKSPQSPPPDAEDVWIASAVEPIDFEVEEENSTASENEAADTPENCERTNTTETPLHRTISYKQALNKQEGSEKEPIASKRMYTKKGEERIRQDRDLADTLTPLVRLLNSHVSTSATSTKSPTCSLRDHSGEFQIKANSDTGRAARTNHDDQSTYSFEQQPINPLRVHSPSFLEMVCRPPPWRQPSLQAPELLPAPGAATVVLLSPQDIQLESPPEDKEADVMEVDIP